MGSDASRQNPMMPRNIKDALSTSTICPFCSLHIGMIRCFGRPLVERLQRLAFLRRREAKPFLRLPRQHGTTKVRLMRRSKIGYRLLRERWVIGLEAYSMH